MSEGNRVKITSLLDSFRRGEEGALTEILEVVYPELRRIAGCIMRKERSGHTLQPTGLVNEAFFRLFNGDPIPFENSQEFFAASVCHMRRVITDHARRHLAAKRQPVETGSGGPDICLEQLVDVSRALDELANHDPEAARIVELKFYAGLSISETAAVLQSSPRSVVRTWSWARAWLYRRLGGAESAPFTPSLVNES